jgi:RimJ/RimL family protein N-acetyltransferase
MEIRRLQLGTIPGNSASERVAEKTGFAREGVLRSYADQRGDARDVTMWSLLPSELG